MDLKALSLSPLIDLRREELFKQSHIANSTNIPVAQLEQRIHELPDKTQRLNILGDNQDIELADKILAAKGYSISLRQILEDERSCFSKDSAHLVKGNRSRRLWKPAKVVQQFIDQYSDLCMNKKGLDLACGSGRDSVCMANNGWSMTSVDYSQSALDRLQSLAKINQQRVDVKKIDLERNPQQLDKLAGLYSAVIVIRYLHRDLFEQLRSLIAPKGFIIYQTFLTGCEQFGSPKNPRFLLNPGELADRFSDFKIYEDKIEYLNDGRPTNCFIAQKKRPHKKISLFK